MNEIITTLEVLKKLNEHSGNTIYQDDKIKSAQCNIQEIQQIHTRLDDILKTINEIPEYNKVEITNQLIQMDMVYSEFVWQYEQMSQMVKEMIASYK